ncbi:MAG: restriction endonuclease subunit S [Bacteroidales bacterium]|nr:restriction endonuclease subunit S [Bacteroidales bacterium]
MEMKKYRLGEIAQLGSGSTPTSSIREYYDGGTIPWINSGELSNPFIAETNNYITELGFKHSSTKMYKKNDTVLLAMYGATAGKASLLQIDACTNQAICAIIPNKDVVEPVILKYKLDTIYQYLVKISTGSARDNLSQKGISNLEISLPNLDIQRKIAAVLTALDDKIALNRRINAKLEQMAKRLYDYWFVQFDFPNAEGKPYKSSGGKMVWNEQLKREISEGWDVKNIGSVISKIASGKRPAGGIDKKLKEGIPSLGAECIDELGVFDYKKTPFIPFSFESSISSGIIEDGDILVYKDGAYVGKTTLFQDEFPFKVAYVNEHVFLIHTKRENLKEYLLFTLKNPTYFEIMQRLGKAKAAQPGLNQDDLCGIPIIIPSDEILNKYNASVKDLFHLLFKKSLETARLTALRDKLLPLLMNGQVTVK